jgi:hypothetical protein
MKEPMEPRKDAKIPLEGGEHVIELRLDVKCVDWEN